jgi:glycopeptide antibiotics resistance protein
MNSLGCFSGALLAYYVPKVFSTRHMQSLGVKLRNLPTLFFISPVFIIGLVLTDSLSIYFLRSEKMGTTTFNWQFILEPIWIWQIILFYIPLGILSTWFIKRSFLGKPAKIQSIFTFLLALLYILIFEIIKYSIFNKFSPPTQLIIGISGILIGMVISEIMGNDRSKLSTKIRIRLSAILAFLSFLYLILIIYKFSYPFHISFNVDTIFDKLAFFLFSFNSILPFTGIHKLFIYSLQNILLFFPMGMFLQELDYYLDESKTSNLILYLAIFLTIFPVIIQLINHHQIPFLFEIPTNVLGIAFGYSAWISLREIFLAYKDYQDK